MTFALRHGAEKLNLNMAPDGFVAVSELLALGEFRGLSLPLIQDIVSKCPKQRFALKQEGGRWFVRANQGHTSKLVTSSALLTPISSVHELPNGTCIHGTYRRFLPQIQANGLSRMKRNNIHFTPHLVSDPKRPHSGFRSSCDTLIYLDMEALLAAGFKLFMSSNGVILSPGNAQGFIPPRYFAKIVDRRTNRIVSCAAPAAAPAAAAPALPPATSRPAFIFFEQERARLQKSDMFASKHAHRQTAVILTYLTEFTKRLRGAFGSSPEPVKIKINKLFREIINWDVIANKPLPPDRPRVRADINRLLTGLETGIGGSV